MARKTITDMSTWPSLSLEGNLIAPAMIAKIDQRQAPEQTPEDYAVRKGLQIREEIATAFRVGQSHFDAFAKIEHPSAATTTRFISGLFKETFGYDDLKAASAPMALSASGRVPIVVVPPQEQIDRRSPTLSTDRSRSPAFALQDYLNDRDDALWGIVTNGAQLRLMRDNASLTRPAYIEADFAQMFVNEDIASFAVLWLLIHRSRFGAADTPATDCALERWRDAGSKEGEAARDRLADQVQLSLKLLGSGFLEANPDLAAKLRSGEANLTEWFNELLRLVYRLIFLMVAEDRNLLHPDNAGPEARNLYAEGYSLQSLRKQCYRAATWDKHHDRYEGVKVVFRALTHGQPALALPALGGLFAEDRLPHLETASLRNRAFMEALYRLSWLADKNGMVPVNWRAMETEELGSVYESLLELQPQLGDDGKTLVFASEAAEQKGNQRKTTGSYYTPDSLVQVLLDTALDPVLDKTETEADDPAKALLKLSVIDPACGSGHFLLAAARRIATRLARIRAEGTPSLADFRHALRDVARCCIHGVDRNPMAVELTKVALWIETVDPGLPLGFFDAQIRCGDALLGVFDLKVLEEGIPDAAYKPLTGDDKETAKYYLKANRDATAGQGGFDFGSGQASMPAMKPLALDFSGFRDLPEDTVEQIGAKTKRFKELRKGQTFVRARAAADLYVAAFLLPKVGDAPAGASERTVPTTEELWMALNQGRTRQTMVDAPKAARNARALHWPLEFPDMMQRGGFDVVLGNPPWERIKVQEHEFFASRDPRIGSEKSAKARSTLISALQVAPNGSVEQSLYLEFESARREAEAISTFVLLPGNSGGRFPLCGRGDVNTYALFAELFDKIKRRGGRSGIIVPTGIATDALTAPFFANLVDEKRLAGLIDFENRAKIFADVDSRMKFCLLTLGDSEPEARFAFFLTETSQLGEAERIFTLSPEQIAAINPNTKTTPVFRSRQDANITAKVYRTAPVLIEKARGDKGNPWHIAHASTFFDMTRDVRFFFSASELKDRGQILEGNVWLDPGKLEPSFLPLFESKMLHILDHRWSSSESDQDDDISIEVNQKVDPRYEPLPRFWVPVDEIHARLQKQGWQRDWLIGMRKITNATNERTVISAIFPKGAVGNSAHILFPKGNISTAQITFFVGAATSLVLDYVARQKIGGTNLNFFYLEQLPFLAPDQPSETALSYVSERVLELTYTSYSLAPFARDLGYDGVPFAWDEDRRALLRAELDAFYARAYGVTRDELSYILDPAVAKGPDYPSETFRVLKEKEIRQHDEYRTGRLVLEAWDRMQQEGTFAALGMVDPISAAAQPIELPSLGQLPDAVWAWSQASNEHDRVRTQLRALVGILPEPSDVRRVRLSALACLQPALLDGFLSETDRREWQRLVAHPANVTQLVPPTNAAWGAAFSALVSSAVLDVSSDGALWSAGKRLDRSTLNAHDPAVGRALFAWSRLEGISLDRELAQVPAVILPFIREGRVAA
ncbi:Eco57I restriction-modification methylase domain-containing protein [Rhizobium sp. Leaf341]|uniref:Eco57I restriction-modification methylase domain-containing protein n=1 Tax=Rhizobium sp. Leaf341 TaxID=1736344 RepID=UPI000712EBD9|nr:N-6 DNA methylase [Rhizobium sp. Leaf341]KQR77610.1 restriction endonuclease [Rhizobium sp. Leaf341]